MALSLVLALGSAGAGLCAGPADAPSAAGARESGTKAGVASAPFTVFTDVTERARIRFRHSYGDEDLSNIVEGTGSGAMFFDYDGDGWLDIYFANGAWLKNVNDVRGRHLDGAQILRASRAPDRGW